MSAAFSLTPPDDAVERFECELDRIRDLTARTAAALREHGYHAQADELEQDRAQLIEKLRGAQAPARRA